MMLISAAANTAPGWVQAIRSNQKKCGALRVHAQAKGERRPWTPASSMRRPVLAASCLQSNGMSACARGNTV